MSKTQFLFISLNRNSYVINRSIINKLDKNIISFKHILIIPKEEDYYKNDDITFFNHTLISIIRLALFSSINKNKYSKIILPHYDIPIIRLIILLIGKSSNLVIIPDGVMFPSDISFIKNREKKIKKLFFPFEIKITSYKIVNKILEKIILNREFFYQKSTVFSFGEYFWEYYSLLNVKKDNFKFLGSPIFEDYLKRTKKNKFNKSYIITFFSQPFIEENWISEIKFNKCMKILSEILNKFNIKLIIKLHPSQDLAYYENNFQKLGIVDYQLEKSINNMELIIKSDFILAYNTTVICDALILKKNVVIFNLFNFKRLNEYENYLRLTSVHSKIELEELIKNYYFNKKSLNEIDYSLLNKFINLNVNSSSDIAKLLSKKDI